MCGLFEMGVKRTRAAGDRLGIRGLLGDQRAGVET